MQSKWLISVYLLAVTIFSCYGMDALELNVPDEKGKTILDYKIERFPHSVREIAELVEKGAIVISAETQERFKSDLNIWEMAFQGHVSMVKLTYHYNPALLNEQCTSIKRENYFWGNIYERVTPLAAAAKGLGFTGANQNSAVAQFLLERGADPEIPDGYGNFPIHYAVQGQNTRETFTFVEQLLKRNKDLANQLTLDNSNYLEKRSTPLHGFASTNHTFPYQACITLITLLHEYGADYLSKDATGKTALDVAQMGHKKEMAIALIDEKHKHYQPDIHYEREIFYKEVQLKHIELNRIMFEKEQKGIEVSKEEKSEASRIWALAKMLRAPSPSFVNSAQTTDSPSRYSRVGLLSSSPRLKEEASEKEPKQALDLCVPTMPRFNVTFANAATNMNTPSIITDERPLPSYLQQYNQVMIREAQEKLKQKREKCEKKERDKKLDPAADQKK